MRADPAKREILWQRTRSPYLQEMCKETKGTIVKRDRSLMHIAMCINSIPGLLLRKSLVYARGRDCCMNYVVL